MTEEQYYQTLYERGLERLQQASVTDNFEASVFTDTNNSFKYGTDYQNGDIVSVIDRQLGIRIDAQIRGVTRSLTQERGEITDLIFSNSNFDVRQI